MLAVVGVMMGSKSDWEVMKACSDVLEEFGVAHEVRVLSAHRTPDATAEYTRSARSRGLKVIVAAAGGAAHLAGVVAAYTTLPVIAVPIKSKSLDGLDSLLSMVQMPSGIPVATVAIDGAKNAGLLAVEILATSDEGLAEKLEEFRKAQSEQVMKMSEGLRKG